MFTAKLKQGVKNTWLNRLRAKQLAKKLTKTHNQATAARELLQIAEDVEAGKITQDTGKSRAAYLYAKYGLK
jgi:hypothetical protein